jgi:DNA gyrase subunit A
VVKKTHLSAYRNHRKGGLIGINVDDGDTVIEARKTTGDDHLLILTHHGKGLRFHENQLRNQGRATRGVRGIRRRDGDYVESMLVVDDERLLLIAGSNGLGIRTVFSAFLPRGGEGEDNTPRKRGGYGVIAMDAKALAGALAVDEDDEIMMLTKKGQAIRCPVLNIRSTNRGTKGVKLVDLAKGDRLVAISRVVKMQEDELEDEENKPSHEDEQALDPDSLAETANEEIEENPEESINIDPDLDDDAVEDSSEEGVSQEDEEPEDEEPEEPSKSDPPETAP